MRGDGGLNTNALTYLASRELNRRYQRSASQPEEWKTQLSSVKVKQPDKISGGGRRGEGKGKEELAAVMDVMAHLGKHGISA